MNILFHFIYARYNTVHCLTNILRISFNKIVISLKKRKKMKWTNCLTIISISFLTYIGIFSEKDKSFIRNNFNIKGDIILLELFLLLDKNHWLYLIYFLFLMELLQRIPVPPLLFSCLGSYVRNYSPKSFTYFLRFLYQ